MVDQALASIAQKARSVLNNGTAHGAVGSEHPRYELFHAASSICSQKVRAVLAHHGYPYVEHTLDIFLGQTYLPDYVRLRMVGCEDYGGALVSRHAGSTAATAGGCDGAVVPTLIDWAEEAVIVDSRRICIHLDQQVAQERRLRPDHLVAEIDDDLKTVDNLPNYQMLMGRTVGGAESDATRKGVGSALSLKKVAACDRYLEQCRDDPVLVAAYTAKRAKELSAADHLFTPEAMQAAYQAAETALKVLDDQLGTHGGVWLWGDRITMSDIFWGIELLRMDNVGVAHMWQDARLDRVAQYARTTAQIPAVQAAVQNWPGAVF